MDTHKKCRLAYALGVSEKKNVDAEISANQSKFKDLDFLKNLDLEQINAEHNCTLKSFLHGLKGNDFGAKERDVYRAVKTVEGYLTIVL